MSTPGIVVEVHRRAADLDADREHVLRVARREQRLREAQVGQRRGAALTDQVECLNVARQPEPLDHVTREPGTKVSGARADDHGVDVGRQEPGVVERACAGLGGERRRVRHETRVQRVGIDSEAFVERVERKTTGLDPVVVEQHGFRDRVGAAVEATEPLRCREGIPALGLAVALRRVGGAQSVHEHVGGPLSIRDGIRRQDRLSEHSFAAVHSGGARRGRGSIGMPHLHSTSPFERTDWQRKREPSSSVFVLQPQPFTIVGEHRTPRARRPAMAAAMPERHPLEWARCCSPLFFLEDSP